MWSDEKSIFLEVFLIFNRVIVAPINVKKYIHIYFFSKGRRAVERKKDC